MPAPPRVPWLYSDRRLARRIGRLVQQFLHVEVAGGAVLLTFAMALLIVYLVLAAQFESFIHPLSIMLTVPLAVYTN